MDGKGVKALKGLPYIHCGLRLKPISKGNPYTQIISCTVIVSSYFPFFVQNTLKLNNTNIFKFKDRMSKG